jgi:hypothetical protein
MKINDIMNEGRWDRRDAYQRDYDSSVSGFGRGHRDMDDEANLLYIYRDGRVMQRMVGNHEERQARREGYRDTPEQALKLHNIIRSKFDPKKWVQKQGEKWVQVHPFGKPELEEAEVDMEEPQQEAPAIRYGMPGFDDREQPVQETIVKKGDEYEVQSKSGKNLGRSDTKAGAVKRLGQVEWFKKHK